MNRLSSSSEKGLSKSVYLPSAITELMTSAISLASLTVAGRIVTFIGDPVDSHSGGIFECGVKGTSALSCEIHDIPDRSQLVDATFLNIGSQPWMPGIRVTDRTVAIASENGYCRILVSFFVFAAEIVLKCA